MSAIAIAGDVRRATWPDIYVAKSQIIDRLVEILLGSSLGEGFVQYRSASDFGMSGGTSDGSPLTVVPACMNDGANARKPAGKFRAGFETRFKPRHERRRV